MKLICSAPGREPVEIEISDRSLEAAIAAARTRVPWAKFVYPARGEKAAAVSSERSAIRVPRMERFAVCVTVHEPYLEFLRDCLPAWNAQAPHADKFLICDRCEPDFEAVKFLNMGWSVVRGDFGHPSHARNQALALTECDWIWFWDADNVPAPKLFRTGLEAAAVCSEETAVLYPGGATRIGDPREHFLADTGSCWRTRALRHVGGWPVTWLEDWNLTQRLHAAGWELEPLDAPLTLRLHAQQRRYGAPVEEKLWDARALGIVTLFRGDKRLLDHWEANLERLELPAHVGLTVVDDSGRAAFTKKLQRTLQRVSWRFQRVTLLQSPFPGGAISTATLANHRARHDRVGGLYSQAIRCTPEALILTWEDDTMPTGGPRAIAELCGVLGLSRKRAAVAALYPSRHDRRMAVASPRDDAWVNRIEYAEFAGGGQPDVVGMVGGGFTVWSRVALEQCPVLGSKAGLGWDGYVCERLNRAGWTVWLHGGVCCEHLVD